MAEATQESAKPVEVEETPERTIESLGEAVLALIQAHQNLTKQGIQLPSTYKYEERMGKERVAGVLFQDIRKSPYRIGFRDGNLIEIHGPSGVEGMQYFNLWATSGELKASITDGLNARQELELKEALPTIKTIVRGILT